MEILLDLPDVRQSSFKVFSTEKIKTAHRTNKRLHTG